MNTQNKKIFSKMLLFFVVFTFVVGVTMGPLEVKTAEASNAINPVKDLECGFFNIDSCIAYMGYYAFYMPASGFLIVSGGLFDAMLAFSLSNEVINQPFVMDAWKTVRDIVNISFIFILLYIAISTILGAGDYKKLLTNLIIVALVINFSAFFTKIVIDASNIVALEFYNAISVNSSAASNTTGISVQEKKISKIFLNGFDPQKLMGSEAVQDWKKAGRGVSTLFFVFLAASVVTLVASFVLFMAGFLMLGRVIAFWFLIIASPIAFISIVIPGFNGFFKKWTEHLINQAFVAPVFLFFMYIIANIVNSNFLKNIFKNPTDNAFDIIISIVLTFSVLLLTLLKALDVTKGLSGEIGAMTTKYAGGNFAMKQLRAGGKILGRHTIGRGAAALAENDRVRAFGRRNPGIGMAIDSTLNNIGGGKYNKYIKETEKAKTAYGAKTAKETRKDKLKRFGYEDNLKKQHEQGVITKKEYDDSLAYLEMERSATEKENREQFTYNLENPNRAGKAWQKITGTEIADREAARKVRDKKEEGSKAEKIKKLIEEAIKEEDAKKAPPAGESSNTK